MAFTPNTFSDYAVEVDIRRIEDQRERAENSMIDAVCDEELFVCPVCGELMTEDELDDDGMCNTCADTAREASVG